MFSSVGLFQGVGCPQGANCSLLNCIFSHVQSDSLHDNDAPVTDVPSRPVSTAEPQEPPLKRRRLSPIGKGILVEPEKSKLVPATQQAAPTSCEPTQKSTLVTTPPTRELVNSNRSKIRGPRTSIERTVSPPLIHSSRNAQQSQHEKTTSPESGAKSPTGSAILLKESLTPRLLTPNPAAHPVRLAVLKKIHEQITRLNDEALRDHATKRALVLSETEVITMALDEEEKLGKEHPQIYKNVVGHRIQRLKKMKLDDWKSSVLEEFQKRYMPPKPPPAAREMSVETGLTARQEIAVLAHLITPLKGLEAHGYVTAAPTAEEIEAATAGVEAAGGFERCDRCGTRFRVFPGRNSDETSKSFGRLTSTEMGCTYHFSRPFRPAKSSTGAGEQESYHLCCRAAIGSKGCTSASDHVFKVSEVKRMASVLQFESTPWPEDPDRERRPIAFDCEMGYTTFGMELIRLTAVSWPSNQQVLDVLVRPLGEVIDYNTRFSGVSQEHFSKGLPYSAAEKSKPGQDDSPALSEDGELEQEQQQQPLQVVESPIVARKLLFDLLTPDTPLIGHAIDNDLNTCRIIHPTIVDTVLLFPHPRGLPVRYGLKMLTAKYLERSIQTGGALGHDSKEDARATGDLVRFKVGEKWKHMRLQGWTFQDHELIPPPPPPPAAQAVKVADGVRVLKRPASQLDGATEGDQ
jgi:hypothetical protein